MSADGYMTTPSRWPVLIADPTFVPGKSPGIAEFLENCEAAPMGPRRSRRSSPPQQRPVAEPERVRAGPAASVRHPDGVVATATRRACWRELFFEVTQGSTVESRLPHLIAECSLVERSRSAGNLSSRRTKERPPSRSEW
jgi:hypothetical protein